MSRRFTRVGRHWCHATVVAFAPIGAALAILTVYPAVAATTRGPTIVIRPSPDDDRQNIALYETDEFNTAKLCAQGIIISKNHRSRSCALGRSRTLNVATTFGGVTLTMFATRSSYDSDGGYGLREEVVILDEKGSALHTLVQWRHDRLDEHSDTLRRKFRIVNVDRRDDDELCIQSTTTTGPGRFDTASTYRATQQWTGYDAYTWHNGRFVRAESLDGSCPTRGYRLFVSMPLTDDAAHRSRDR